MMSQAVAHDFFKKTRTGDVLISENVDFAGMLLSESLLSGLTAAGFKRPSPIQLKAIPLGRCGLDLIVQAKSGTGKTVVFTVISLESIQLSNVSSTQVLVVAPTREIAVQIWEVMNSVSSQMTGVYCQMFIGGTLLNQDKQKLKKCHIAIGTPGRIKQLIELDIFNTQSVRVFILDEADKLLEDSFKEQINWIYSMLPENKQMLALSATYPEYMAQQLTLYMRDPTFVRLNSQDPALLGIKQYFQCAPFHPFSHKVFENKTKLMVKLLSSVTFHQCLVFSNLQTRAQSLCDILNDKGWPSECIAGCLEQQQRLDAMEKLKTFKCRILISTDLTSRGIDAENVNLVINLDIPLDHETYLHRIGRAGRFGSFGAAVTLISGEEEKSKLRSLEEKCNTTIHPLSDPIPTDLVERDVPVDLRLLVSAEQIKTRGNSSQGHDLHVKNGAVIQTSQICNNLEDSLLESNFEKVHLEDSELTNRELSTPVDKLANGNVDLLDVQAQSTKTIATQEKTVENNINGKSDHASGKDQPQERELVLELVHQNLKPVQKDKNGIKTETSEMGEDSITISKQQIKKMTSKKGKPRKSYKRDDPILLEEFGGGSSFEVCNTDIVILERPNLGRKTPPPFPRPEMISIPDIPIPDFSKSVSSNKAPVSMSQPAVPTSQPAVPTSHTAVPTSQPAVAISQPAVPTSQPAVPISQPTVPISQPAVPISQPAVPTSQPEVPIIQPAVPTSQPAVPISQLAVAVSQPAVPISQLAVAVSQPAVPISQLPVAVSQPAMPSIKLAVQSSKPAVPISQPLVPISHPKVPSSEATVSSSEPPVEKDPVESMVTNAKIHNEGGALDTNGLLSKVQTSTDKKKEVSEITNDQMSPDSQSHGSNVTGRKIITATRRRKIASTNNPLSQVSVDDNQFCTDKKKEFLSVNNGDRDFNVQEKDPQVSLVNDDLQVNNNQKSADTTIGISNNHHGLGHEDNISDRNLCEVSFQSQNDNKHAIEREDGTRSRSKEIGSVSTSNGFVKEDLNPPSKGHTYSSALENYETFLQKWDMTSAEPRQSNILNLMLKKCQKPQQMSLNSELTLEDVTSILADLDLRKKTKPSFRDKRSGNNHNIELHQNVETNVRKVDKHADDEKSAFVSTATERASDSFTKKQQPSNVFSCNKGPVQSNSSHRLPSKEKRVSTVKEVKKQTEVTSDTSMQNNSSCPKLFLQRNNTPPGQKTKLKDPNFTPIDHSIKPKRKASQVDKGNCFLRSLGGDVKEMDSKDSSDEKENAENEETSGSCSSSDSSETEFNSESESDSGDSDEESSSEDGGQTQRSSQSQTQRSSQQTSAADGYNVYNDDERFSYQRDSGTYPSYQGHGATNSPTQGQTQSNYQFSPEFCPGAMPPYYMHPYYNYMGYPPWSFLPYSYAHYPYQVNQPQCSQDEHPTNTASINNFVKGQFHEMENVVAGTQKMKELMKCQFDYLYYMKKA